MVDSTLKRELITHNIYSAWQFIEYTEKNIATVHYCADTIKNIIDKMAEKQFVGNRILHPILLMKLLKMGKM